MSSTEQRADNCYVPSSIQDLTAAGLMQVALDAVKRQAAGCSETQKRGERISDPWACLQLLKGLRARVIGK